MFDIPERSLIEPEPVTNRPICPRCGAEAQTFYRDLLDETFGCDECVVKVDWTEISEEENRYYYDACVDAIVNDIVDSRLEV